MTSSTSSSASTRTSGRAYAISPDLSLEPCSSRGKGIGRNLFINMNRLSMLAEVVQTGEAAVAMTLEWTFSSMLPNMTSQMLASSKTQIAGWIARAEEPLALLLAGGRVSLT